MKSSGCAPIGTSREALTHTTRDRAGEGAGVPRGDRSIPVGLRQREPPDGLLAGECDRDSAATCRSRRPQPVFRRHTKPRRNRIVFGVPNGSRKMHVIADVPVVVLPKPELASPAQLCVCPSGAYRLPRVDNRTECSDTRWLHDDVHVVGHDTPSMQRVCSSVPMDEGSFNNIGDTWIREIATAISSVFICRDAFAEFTGPQVGRINVQVTGELLRPSLNHDNRDRVAQAKRYGLNLPCKLEMG